MDLVTDDRTIASIVIRISHTKCRDHKPLYAIRLFPVIHKVGNVDIFVQILMEINRKHFRAESVSLQNHNFHVALDLN